MKKRHVLFLLYYIIFLHIFKNLKNSTLKLKLKNKEIEKSLNSWNYELFKTLFPINYTLSFKNNYNDLQFVYIITPTFTRTTQIADLTRMKNTLLLVPKLVWILVEDSTNTTNKVESFVKNSNLNIIHLNEKTMPIKKPEGKIGHKGVEQRNRGIKWLKDYKKDDGVFYFADDDNSYDLKLFEEIRSVKKIGVWPVGLVGGLKYERPICDNGKVIDWFFAYNPYRYFPTDMASFAIHTKLLHQFEDTYFERFTRADLEGVFLKKFDFKIKDLEAKANNCLKINVWHTRTKRVALPDTKTLNEKMLNLI